MRTVTVELGDRSYPIHVGLGTCRLLHDCISRLPAVRQTIVIADQTVADLHAERLSDAIGKAAVIETFQPGEASKSLATVEQLCQRLAHRRVERSDLIIAFGGGVAGDLAGYVAACYLRGVRFVQVPTTLLATVDSSVGGKTGVNLPGGKNLVGAFHQPQAVIVDTDFLRTLPPRELAGGLAESVKHALIRSSEFLDWHIDHADALHTDDADTLAELIARNCAIKADVVSQDEREAGLRAILNYGHTIGHAIEHLAGYELRHGECVALGMLVENEIAVARGWLERATADTTRDLLQRLKLPTQIPPGVDAAAIWNACQVDKKNRAGAVNFVLLRGVGAPVRVADVTAEEVAGAVTRVMQQT